MKLYRLRALEMLMLALSAAGLVPMVVDLAVGASICPDRHADNRCGVSGVLLLLVAAPRRPAHSRRHRD